MSTIQWRGAVAVGLVVLAGGWLMAWGQEGSKPGAAAGAQRVRVGTYNSRAVALAYGRSAEFLAQADKAYKEGQKLKGENDKKQLEELKELMASRQHDMHAMVFSNAPIDGIMKKMQGALPEIAAKAGVSAIVPEVDYHDAGVDVVDVTDALVAHFQPTEKTLDMIREMAKHPPMSFYELSKHKD